MKPVVLSAAATTAALVALVWLLFGAAGRDMDALQQGSPPPRLKAVRS